MTENDIIWQTDAKLRNEYDIVENVKLTLDENGIQTIWAVQSTEQKEDISIQVVLSLKEAINLGVALIRSAGCMEAEEDD